MPESDSWTVHNPAEQLARLQKLCRHRSVLIYRQQALYLQILRDELRDATRQALFRLISDVDPGRFGALSESTRLRFHEAVDQLIQRCSVLLTVEHLRLLAAQMVEETRRRQAQASRDLLEGLSHQQNQLESNQRQDRQEPYGSIHLSLDPPVGETQTYPPRPVPVEEQDANQDQNPAAVPPIAEQELEHDQSDLDVLRSLFQLAGDALEHTALLDEIPSPSIGQSNSEAGHTGFMPELPDALLDWMEAIDLALSRRLRNLSHAINVEMLRCGLANTLLPVTLLEAVLHGQVETQSTASNLIRLRLPMAIGEIEQGVDVLCILLRISELEFDSPRLRRCRRKLRELHRDLHTMVRQQRHWQRRSLDQEVRTHWQSPTDSNPPPLDGD